MLILFSLLTLNAQTTHCKRIDGNLPEGKILNNETLQTSVINESYDEVFIDLNPSNTLNNTTSSGTGFALTSNGLIVTNYHVVAGAASINVKGINGNFSISYNAKAILFDRTNDLAIIQIEDHNFCTIDSIPYVIKPLSSDVGENIFVLGFPLRASMGDEIKLTNGIISSKTGFQGDITSYQISAPIQPGNSGGPLFNHEGGLIGIIKAKHRIAENVSYAVKVSYLKNLIDLLPVIPVLNIESSMCSLSLPEQVKVLNKYVYVIEKK